MSTFRIRRPARRQRRTGGYLMIEMGLYLVIAAMLIATVKLPEMIREIEDNQAVGSGQYATTIRTAVNRYVVGNKTQIVAGVVPGFINALAPTVEELITTKYLPAGFGLRTPLGQSFKVKLALQACPGVNCEVVGLAYSAQPLNDEAGRPRIPLLGTASSTIGSDGYISFPAAPAVMTGAGGSTTANPVAGTPAGILGIRVGFGSYGYANVASDVVGPCVYISGSNGQIQVKCDGSVTVTDGTNTSTMDASGFYAPNGVVQTNNMITSGDNYLQGKATADTACTADGATRTNANGTGLVICGNGKWQPVGTAIANITAGMACATNGQIATSGSNVGFICRGGQYQALTSAFGTMTMTRKIENVTDGMTFGKDNCPGGTPWALFTGKFILVNVTGYIMPPIQGSYYAAVDQGTYWYAQASAKSSAAWYSGNDTGALGGQLVGTFTTGCAY